MVEQVITGNRKIPLLAIMVLALCIATTTSAQETKLEKSFSNVVMITGKHKGTSTFGAGIVIGSRAGRIYIATANHVVRSNRTAATDIMLEFRFLPGEKFPARLLETKSKDLDLAVLSIIASADEIPPNQFNYNMLGRSAGLRRGSDVHPLGNPGAQSWGVSIAPEKVDSMRPTEIVFQSSYIQQGHSGGALLDGCGDVVGLIVRDSPPNGRAVRIESILEALRQWNYPINLQASGGCTPSTQANLNQPTEPDQQSLELEQKQDEALLLEKLNDATQTDQSKDKKSITNTTSAGTLNLTGIFVPDSGFEDLVLVQNGNKVRGKIGTNMSTLEGVIEGEKLIFTFKHSRTGYGHKKGRGEFTISKDGNRLTGTRSNAGFAVGSVWNLTRDETR